MLVAALAALAVLIVGAFVGVILFRRDAAPLTQEVVPTGAPGGVPFDAQDAREAAFLEYSNRGTPDSRLITTGIITAILFPIGGIVVGIMLLFKERVGPGLGCILLSMLAFVVYFTLLVG